MINEPNAALLERLAERLERLSADSIYAHRASGLRGSFLRAIERIRKGDRMDEAEFDQLVAYGYEVLDKAAKEIGAHR